MELGQTFAWLAFLGAVFLLGPAAILARVQRLRAWIRPVALLGCACAVFTAANALVRLREWDVVRSYGEMIAAGSTDSNAGVLAAMLIPVWPYAAVVLGCALAALYAYIAWRPRSSIAFMTPAHPQPDRIARERARVARFDE